MFLVSNVIDAAQSSLPPQFTHKMARKSRRKLALFTTFPAVFAVFYRKFAANDPLNPAGILDPGRYDRRNNGDITGD
jgi:hypothetical protein